MKKVKELGGALLEHRPLVFAEKKPKVGSGGKAFKTLTAAVRAAEAARDEVRGALAEVLPVCSAARDECERALRCMRRLLLWNVVAALVGCSLFVCRILLT